MLIPVLFHKIYLYTAAIVSLLANGTLLLLLISRSSAQLGNYRLLLVAFALTDVFISLFHAWYIPMFLLGEYGYIFFGYGTMLKRGPVPLKLNLMYSTVFFTPFCLLCLHFIYRFLSLNRPSLLKGNLSFFNIFSVVYTLLYTTGTGLITDAATGKILPRRFEYLVAEYAKGNEEFYVNIGTIDLLNDDLSISKSEVMILAGAFAISGHTVLISLFCIHKILGILNDRVMEIKTRQMHVHLFRALLIQVNLFWFAVPVLLALLPFGALVFLPITGISLGQWGNFCSLLPSSFPALDPILIILSIKRFRSTLVQWADALFGNTAARNEARAIEQSKSHYSMIVRRPTRSSFH